MYFVPGPKESKEDLYGFDNQLKNLLGILKGRRESAPLIFVKGSRRTGKTSSSYSAQ